MPYWKAPRGPQMMFITALGILQGVMLLVLLAVCGNTANLVLARASSRYREVGVRLALGAGPGNVIRLMLDGEPAARHLGAVVGILIAWWGTEALRSMPPYGAFPVRFQTSLDAIGLAFAVVLGIGSGLLFGAAPALQLGRIDPQQALQERIEVGGPKRGSRRPDGACNAVSPCSCSSSPASSSKASSRRATPIPGFSVEGLLLATYDLSGTVTTDEYPRQFATDLLDRLQRVPSVQSVALANSMPLDIHGLPLRGFTLEGRAQTTAQQESALSNIVSPGYFKTMGIPIVAGEDFADMADRIAAAAGDRQRGVRAPLHRAGGSDWATAEERRSDLHDRRRGEELDLRRLRRAADAGVLLLVSRSRRAGSVRFTCARGRDRKRCSPRKCSAPSARSTRRCRSTTSGRWRSTSSATCSCARFRRGCSW